MKVPAKFYINNDVVTLSRMVLGMHLFTQINGEVTGGKIVETEAYCGGIDRGSHAYNNRHTPRTHILFENGGFSYVYLCYGIHYLFNLVTGDQDHPHAILIRGLEPVTGLPIMLERRNFPILKPSLTAGPGALASAMGIGKEHNALPLTGDTIWLEDSDHNKIKEDEILTRSRVGMNFDGPWHSAPLRFSIRNNPFVSKAL